MCWEQFSAMTTLNTNTDKFIILHPFFERGWKGMFLKAVYHFSHNLQVLLSEHRSVKHVKQENCSTFYKSHNISRKDLFKIRFALQAWHVKKKLV